LPASAPRPRARRTRTDYIARRDAERHCQEIGKLLACHEFRRDRTRSLELALPRTFGVAEKPMAGTRSARREPLPAMCAAYRRDLKYPLVATGGLGLRWRDGRSSRVRAFALARGMLSAPIKNRNRRRSGRLDVRHRGVRAGFRRLDPPPRSSAPAASLTGE
jgi:hypothetical protein